MKIKFFWIEQLEKEGNTPLVEDLSLEDKPAGNYVFFKSHGSGKFGGFYDPEKKTKKEIMEKFDNYIIFP